MYLNSRDGHCAAHFLFPVFYKNEFKMKETACVWVKIFSVVLSWQIDDYDIQFPNKLAIASRRYRIYPQFSDCTVPCLPHCLLLSGTNGVYQKLA